MFIFHPIGFEGLATMLVSVTKFSKLSSATPTFRDVFAPGSPFRMLDLTCCYRLSDLCSHIGYFTGEFQTSRLIVFAALDAVDLPLVSCMLVHFLDIGAREQTCQMRLQCQWSQAAVMNASSFPVHIHLCLTRVEIIRWTGGILSWTCSILFITAL